MARRDPRMVLRVSLLRIVLIVLISDAVDEEDDDDNVGSGDELWSIKSRSSDELVKEITDLDVFVSFIPCIFIIICLWNYVCVCVYVYVRYI